MKTHSNNISALPSPMRAAAETCLHRPFSLAIVSAILANAAPPGAVLNRSGLADARDGRR
jgi:hypothetical protein